MNPNWAGAGQWRVLNVGVDSSAHFLRMWQSWRADPQRPRMLHYVALCGDAFQNTAGNADLTPLAAELDAHLWGLLPGFHRLVFDGGQVLLTLCIGDVQTLLKQQQFEADAVLLNHAAYAAADTLYTVKAVARLCRRGTALVASSSDSALQAAFKQCGFDISAAKAAAASKESEESRALLGVYNPAWTPKKPLPTVAASTCVVIGAGLAGAAVASSLSRRGWVVTVLDAANQPASGASSLPAGLLVPHTSPDDSWLSRLSRSGVRITLQQARAHLRHGTDWGHTGVLQRYLQDHHGKWPTLPPAWAGEQFHAASDWCYPASAKTLAAAGLPPGSPALWHRQAGWVKPAALVAAWLAAPGVTWRGNSEVAQVKSTAGGWRVLNAAGDLLAQADLLVLAAGYPSQALAATLGQAPDLQAIRGQVTLGLQKDSTPSLPAPPSLPSPILPPFPVNGHGGLVTHITTPDGPMWLMGASYERDTQQPTIKPVEHADNLARLQTLLPDAADALASQFAADTAQGWAGIRCATPNRLPLVMPLTTPTSSSSAPLPTGQGWLCTGMGSRGLSFAALCGELLAAQLHAEPLPVDLPLASALARRTRQPPTA